MEEYKVFSNLNKSLKWRGIIDYKTLIFLCIYLLIIWNILSLFNMQLNVKIYLFIICFIPLFFLVISNTGEDSIIYILYITIKYIISNKIYVIDIEEKNRLELVKMKNIEYK